MSTVCLSGQRRHMTDPKTRLIEQLLCSGIGYANSFSCEGLANCHTGKINDEFFIMVNPVTGEDFYHEARGLIFERKLMEIGNIPVRCLYLSCNKNDFIDVFATVAVDLLKYAHEESGKKDPEGFPERWWARWSDLLGETASSTIVHAWLGELYVYFRLIKAGKNAKWTSLDKGIVDFVVQGRRLEVKSTTLRQESTITASNIFQMDADNDSPLHLVHLRFAEEESSNTFSIDHLLGQLHALIDMSTLKKIESYLCSVGVFKGQLRKKRYRLIEAMAYPVDDMFPRITNQSFKDDIVPPGIAGINYEIDLAAVRNKIPLDDLIEMI